VPSFVDGSDIRYIKKYQLTSEFLSEETSGTLRKMSGIWHFAENFKNRTGFHQVRFHFLASLSGKIRNYREGLATWEKSGKIGNYQDSDFSQ
jgi:hypothetical protein